MMFVIVMVLLQDIIQNKKSTNSKSSDISEEDLYEFGYEEGKEIMWLTLKLAYFDMYSKMEILDFDSQLEETYERLHLISTNKEYCDDVLTNYKKYMESSENDLDNN
jgi:hypothetical protein